MVHRCAAAAAAAAPAAAGQQVPQAALVVIGDEILSGSITDTNTPWLAKASNLLMPLRNSA